MGVLQLIAIVSISFPLANCVLFRSNIVYEHIIKDTYYYYNCNSIVLLYATLRNQASQDVESLTQLKNLQLHLNEPLIPVNIIDIETFASEISKNPSKIAKTLIILLNDYDELKIQLGEKLFPSIDVSKPTWLMFSRRQTEMNDFFSNMYIPFNCVFMVSKPNLLDKNSETITEVYRVYKGKDLQQDKTATWNWKNGTQFSQLFLYRRRYNLHGHTLRVALRRKDPGLKFSYTKDGEIKLGDLAEIIEDLQKKMNFTISYHIINESYPSDKVFNPGHYALLLDVCDILPSTTALTESRIKSLDFTIPLSLSVSYLYMKKPSNKIRWEEYLIPFNTYTWLVIISSIFIFGCLMSAIKLYYQDRYAKRLIANKEPVKLMDNIFLAFGAYTGQAIPRSIIDSVAIIQLTLHMTAVVTVAAYSAVLISLITVNSVNIVTDSIEKLFKDETMKIEFSKSSLYNEMFKTSSDPVIQKLYQKLQGQNLPATLAEGFERVCSKDKYAFLGPSFIATQFQMDRCTLITSKPIFLSSFSFSLQQNNPFLGLFNTYLLALKSNGVVARLLTPPLNIKQKQIVLWKPVEFIDISSLIILLMIHCILGTCVLFVEKLTHKVVRQKVVAKPRPPIRDIQYPSTSCIITIN